MELSYLIPKILRKILNPPAVRNSKIDKTARMDIGTVVSNSSLGKYSYIGEHTLLLSSSVGNYTSISYYCTIGGASHPMEWVSMSPAFHSGGGLMKKKLASHAYKTNKHTVIGSDVWIGAHCLIRGGVTIGNGAVIRMGSVVTKDVGDYEIWAGNPAKMIRKRFDEDTIQCLQNTDWWNWTEEQILANAAIFNDVKHFVSNIKNQAKGEAYDEQ